MRTFMQALTTCVAVSLLVAQEKSTVHVTVCHSVQQQYEDAPPIHCEAPSRHR